MLRKAWPVAAWKRRGGLFPGLLLQMTGFLAVLQSMALAVDLHDVRVMQQPVEERGGERRVIGQCAGPLRERQIAGHFGS